MTPFMLAVSGRAYPAAITVLEAAQKLSKGKVTSQGSAVFSRTANMRAVPHIIHISVPKYNSLCRVV